MFSIMEVDPLIRAKREDLIDAPEYVRVEKFSGEAVEKFAEAMNEAVATGQSVIPVVIDSYGGEVYSLTAMVDIIRSCPVPVVTISLGKSMSCGALLFSFGTKRFIAPHARIMIHDVSSGAFGKIEEIKADVKEAEVLNDIVYEMLDRNCGQVPGYFKQLVHERGHADWYLDAAEAVKHGLATAIGVPKFVTKVSVSMDVVL